MELDDAQRKAVEAEPGALLIVAPPGGGKTHTLVERIGHLIHKHRIAPERILALTFTTKAAREMRERLQLRGLAQLPYCATFHALAYDIVRMHGTLLNIPADFTIVEDEKEKTANTLTFDELLSHALTLLEEHADARSYWQHRFDHILVDEYQDTDDRQDRITMLIAQPHGNVYVIGDPNQAIYGFRGANVENFLTFEKRYVGARTVTLQTNYRSTPTIVEAAHNLIGHEAPRTQRIETGDKITLAAFASPRQEAYWIVKQIEGLIGGMYHESGMHDTHYHPGDIAVLYRFNAIGKELEKAFVQAGIPHMLITEKNLDDIAFDTFCVPLMTMHAAKGLEFPVVFIAGLEDGVSPSFQFNDAPHEERLAEERRLLYVALTRAKDRLFLSHTRGRPIFGKTFSEPSRFLSDIPSQYFSVEERKPTKAYQKRLF